MIYLTLFVISLLSATLLPLGSEALLIYDITQNHNIALLWLVATTGNTIGSIINYTIGFQGKEYLQKKDKISPKQLEKSEKLFQKYGGWTLLLSWTPIIGDPLTLIAGVLKYDIKWFIIIVALAKGVRYGVLVFLVL